MTTEQSAYQVRLGWGRDGLVRVAADADVVVWVDVLSNDGDHRSHSRRRDAGELREHSDLGASDRLPWPPHADVVASDLWGAPAAAAWVAARQEQRARRLTIAVIAAGHAEHDGGYAVEDHLAAGAVIAALGELGIDATSPDAAVADAAYRGLRPAIGHLISASAAGRAAGAEPAAYRAAGGEAAEVRIIQRCSPDPDRSPPA